MVKFYIDVTYTYDYDFSVHKTVESSLMFDIKAQDVKFICNSYARVSSGDLYEITLFEEDDIISFILRTEFIPARNIDEIEKYRSKNKR